MPLRVTTLRISRCPTIDKWLPNFVGVTFKAMRQFGKPRDMQDLGIEGGMFEAARVPVLKMHEFYQALHNKDVEQAWKL